MNKTKRFFVLAWLVAAVCMLFAFGCGEEKGSATVTMVTCEEKTVVLTVSNVQGKFTLLHCLQSLSDEGALTYEMDGTMLKGLGGLQNDDKNFSYWMIYTSDKSNANEAWGTFTYNGETLGSASKGANELRVKDACVYVFSYETMSF